MQLQKLVWADNALVRRHNFHQRREYEYLPLEIKQGTLILVHGNLMHSSGANTSEKNRMAYSFTIIDGSQDCPDDAYLRPLAGEFMQL